MILLTDTSRNLWQVSSRAQAFSIVYPALFISCTEDTTPSLSTHTVPYCIC